MVASMRPRPPIAFSAYPIDKAAHRRRDPAALAEALSRGDARIAVFHQTRPLLLGESGTSAVAEVAWLGPAALDLAGAGALAVFLGEDDGGAAHFALALPNGFDLDGSPIAGLGAFEDMRAAAMRLSPADAALLGCGKALLEWHARHPFCSVCGAASAPADGGWKRVCPSCGAEHFPRVDPVVIMLPVRGERCCLGRQSRFPPGMFSAFAGFVEPGETLEEACARELEEEAGLKAIDIAYRFAQPWPFPSQLMIGLIATVADEALRLGDDEIEEAVWLSREEARAALAGGLEKEGRRLWAPPPIAIAHSLLRDWTDED